MITRAKGSIEDKVNGAAKGCRVQIELPVESSLHVDGSDRYGFEGAIGGVGVFKALKGAERTWRISVAGDLMVTRKGELIETEVDGELVALHVDLGTCYGFNSTATRIWTMIEQPKLFSELTHALVSEFDVDTATCQAQLKDLLDELAADGLVEIRPA